MTRAPRICSQFTSAQDATSSAGPGRAARAAHLDDGNGVTVTKTFVFRRSSSRIGLEYAIDNTSAAPWTAASYARISRIDPDVEQSMFKVESYAFRGPAIYDEARSTASSTSRRRNTRACR